MELKAFLDLKVEIYNHPSFIEKDPISVPHQYSLKQDKEISGFFAAIFSWGGRATIINKSLELMRRMDNAPFHFIKHHKERDLKNLLGFKHRTFNEDDLLYFVHFLHHHYNHHDSLETAFTPWMGKKDRDVEKALVGFHNYFFSFHHLMRTRKHISSPVRQSACKRLNMFLRWMVRKDHAGVDFGLWRKIKPSQLICPLDLHVDRIARKLGLLARKQSDWKAAVELTENLCKLDPADPVKYDLALFGLGIIEKY